jgi:hypothetical protein
MSQEPGPCKVVDNGGKPACKFTVAANRGTAGARCGTRNMRQRRTLDLLFCPLDIEERLGKRHKERGDRERNKIKKGWKYFLVRPGSKVATALVRLGSEGATPLVRQGSEVATALVRPGSEVATALVRPGSEVATALVRPGSEVATALIRL